MREENAEARTMGMLCHLLALSALVGVPVGHILGPLIMWVMKKDQYAFVDDQGKEALNFQISVTIYAAAASVIGLATCGVGFIALAPALAVLVILELALPIMAGLRANEGERYRYPITIRLLK